MRLYGPVANDPVVVQELCTPVDVSALNSSCAVPCVRPAQLVFAFLPVPAETVCAVVQSWPWHFQQ